MINMHVTFLALTVAITLVLFFVDTKEPAIAALIAVVLAWAFATLLTEGQEEKHEFMAQCLTEHKQYECTAMWRAGNHDTTVIYSGK